jgi:hypothetical protein
MLYESEHEKILPRKKKIQDARHGPVLLFYIINRMRWRKYIYPSVRNLLLLRTLIAGVGGNTKKSKTIPL